MRALFIVIILSFIIVSYATTYTVKQDSTGNFTTIQAAIYWASHTDEIIVYPGVYHENLVFPNYRDAKLRSLEATTNNREYVAITIIDGDGLNPCISMGGWDFTSYPDIRGFTITNGSCGIKAYDVTLGIIKNCDIRDNIKSGGIVIDNSDMNLSGVNIFNNNTNYNGGGIKIGYDSEVTFDPVNLCSIYCNSALICNDIYIGYNDHNTNIYLDKFTVANPTSYYVYLNKSIDDDYTMQLDYIQVARQEVNADIYVSPTGSDSNSGLTAQTPLKSLRLAFQTIFPDSLNPKTVHLLPGIYYTGDLEFKFPISLKANVQLSGADSLSTVLFCNSDKRVISSYYQDNISITNLRITSDSSPRVNPVYLSLADNIKVENVSIDNILTDETGPFQCDKTSNVILKNVKFSNINSYSNASINATGFSGKLINCTFEFLHSSHIIDDFNTNQVEISLAGNIDIENCIFNDMTIPGNYDQSQCINIHNGQNSSGYIKVKNCLFKSLNSQYVAVSLFANTTNILQVYNCTFVNCETLYEILFFMGTSDVRNTIMFDTAPDELSFYGDMVPLTIDYSDLPIGIESIRWWDSIDILNWGDHNVSFNPHFFNLLGRDILDFRLGTTSQLIDAGTPDTTGMDLPATDLAGNPRVQNGRIDMGCFETNYDTNVPEPPALISKLSLGCYPNPFSNSATFTLGLPQKGKVKLAIYNVKGQLVKELCENRLTKGTHDYVWDGKDLSGKQCAGGIYFGILQYDKNKLTQKIVLLK